jgi:hypothetical protein
MTPFRRRQLETHPDASLTPEEIDAGYHWCPDWDGAIVGDDDSEIHECHCLDDHEILDYVPGVSSNVAPEHEVTNERSGNQD